MTTSPDLAAWGVPVDPGELARAAIDRGAVQHPGELAELTAFLQRRRLRQVLEIGVMHGGTLWLWRRLCEKRRGGPGVQIATGFVLGVDIQEPPCPDCDERRAHINCPRRQLMKNVFHFGNGEARADLLVGDAQESATSDRVWTHFGPEGVDLLHIDGDHGPAVWRDFDRYAPLVKPDGIIVLHDVTLDAASVWPPAALWETLRGAPGAFTIAHEGGYGFGVLVGNEYRSHLHDG